MSNIIPPSSAEVLAILPPNFLDKKINESFTQKVMSTVLKRTNWTSGDPNRFEPDYFCDNIPFEFTIASDRNRKNNFIQKFFRKGTYCSDDVDQDVFQYISISIEEKSAKKYSVSNVHLCVLCLIDLTGWVLDEYGSLTQDILDWPRQDFFTRIKELYLETETFRNIFFIFPDHSASWWVWDLKSDNKACIRLSIEDVLNRKYPFWITQDCYMSILSETNNH